MISRCSFPSSTELVERRFGPRTDDRTRWHSQQKHTTCGKNLKWRISFSPQPAQGRWRVVQLWRSFPVFETVRDHAQCQCLCPRQRFVPSDPVAEHAWKLDHVSEPALIRLL